MSWSSDNKTLAVTVTANRLANEWETVRVGVIDTTNPSATLRLVQGRGSTVLSKMGEATHGKEPGGDPHNAAPPSFQPFFSPDGLTLAFTQADTSTQYTWAQTWRICTVPVSSLVGASNQTAVCDATKGQTRDEMATLLGWTPDGHHLLYVEQVRD